MPVENQEKSSVFDFNSIPTNNHIQILKAAIPYIEPEKQKFIVIYIKFLELSYTISFFQNKPAPVAFGSCSVPKSQSDKKPDLLELLGEIKCYCSDEEQKFIDSMLNMLNAFQMFNTYQTMMQAMAPADGDGSNSTDPFAMLKGMLSPEQQSMFDMFQNMDFSATQESEV